jgi:hypothetical protein
MTPVAGFTRSVNIAAMPLTGTDQLTFSFGGHPIQLGQLREIGDQDVEVFLSERDLTDPSLSRVVGLICFLADVRGVNLILSLDKLSNEQNLPMVREMLSLNGFSSARWDTDKFAEPWVRLARSIAQ